MRGFLRRSKFVKSKASLRRTFNAWRRLKNNEKNFGHRLTALLEGIRNVNTQQAFDMIKRYAAERYIRGGKNKDKSLAKVQRCLMNQAEFSLRAYFNKLRQWRDRCNTRDTRVNTALRNMQVGYLRSAFLRWKDKAH